MADNLVIVESPAKAETIGKFLGKKFKVVASNGHLRDLPKSQLGVDTENGFEPKYITIRGRGDILNKIKKEAKNAEKIYLATDPDREGEAISWHIANILDIDTSEKCRIVFNEITKQAVTDSLKGARVIDADLVNAQKARRILDRLVGYKISPLLWKTVKKGLSAGRVQSVATRLIVEREEEIESFIPKEYWTITAKLKDKKNKIFEAKYVGTEKSKKDINNEKGASDIENDIKGADFVVKKVDISRKKRHAPAPFTTSNMQQDASRKLGFTTKKTMSVAQTLYEGVKIKGGSAVGLVTYIRTDSVRVAKEAQVAALEYIEQTFGKEYVPSKPNIYKGRKNAQDAHEAIRPTAMDRTPALMKDSLSNDQFKLYKLIYDRFLASQMSDKLFDAQTADIVANGHLFKATGQRPIFDGYTKAYKEVQEEDEEKQGSIFTVEKDDVLKAEEIEKEQHFTQPPSRYNEASLVKALEEKSIGRPSTYAPIISTIIDRGYVKRTQKMLEPTELGRVVTSLMKDNFKDIVDVEFTADMEEKLDEIEEGQKSWVKVLQDFYGPFESTVKVAETHMDKIQMADEVSDVVCEKCGALMVYKFGRFGKFLACPNYPECKNTKAIVETIDIPCPKCGAKIVKKKSKKGKVFYGCERYPECDFVTWDMPTKEKCPKCGNILTVKYSKNKKRFYKCSNNECDFQSFTLKDVKAAEKNTDSKKEEKNTDA